MVVRDADAVLLLRRELEGIDEGRGQAEVSFGASAHKL
jgi:hypothetical protein